MSKHMSRLHNISITNLFVGTPFETKHVYHCLTKNYRCTFMHITCTCTECTCMECTVVLLIKYKKLHENIPSPIALVPTYIHVHVHVHVHVERMHCCVVWYSTYSIIIAYKYMYMYIQLYTIHCN